MKHLQTAAFEIVETDHIAPLNTVRFAGVDKNNFITVLGQNSTEI